MLFAVIREPQYKIPEGVDGIELRVDCFPKVDVEHIGNLVTHSKIPVLITARNMPMQLIRELLHCKPHYFDLDWELPESLFKEVKEAHPSIKIVCSYHNFETTPIHLQEIFQEMQTKAAYTYKIATWTPTTLDALRLIEFVSQQKNVSGICMGPAGRWARVLGPAAGNLIDFSGDDQTLGQLTHQELLGIYSYRTLNAQTPVYGVIGNVEKSVGHIVHNALLQESKQKGVYLKIPLQSSELKDFMALARKRFRGFSVTTPLKEAIVDHLDEIDSEARAIGAVNTVTIKDGRLIGSNTDGRGALNVLGSVEGKDVVLIGAGGAAKAIAWTALQRGARVTLLNRTPKKAEMLAKRMGIRGGGLDLLPNIAQEGYDILINATTSLTPINPQYIIPGSTVMDIHTIPKNTPLLLEAGIRQCRLVYGHEMYFAQAKEQAILWKTL